MNDFNDAAHGRVDKAAKGVGIALHFMYIIEQRLLLVKYHLVTYGTDFTP